MLEIVANKSPAPGLAVYAEFALPLRDLYWSLRDAPFLQYGLYMRRARPLRRSCVVPYKPSSAKSLYDAQEGSANAGYESVFAYRPIQSPGCAFCGAQ
jgi:hypothetical protein